MERLIGRRARPTISLVLVAAVAFSALVTPLAAPASLAQAASEDGPAVSDVPATTTGDESTVTEGVYDDSTVEAVYGMPLAPTTMLLDEVSSQTIYVASGGDNDANGTDPGSAKATIRAALEVVEPGGTIVVAPGVYLIDETIVIDKPLHLRGALADEDPRPSQGGRNGKQSILDGGGTVGIILDIRTDDVTINGFEVRNGTGDLIYHSGAEAHRGIRIMYNDIHSATGDEAIQLKNCQNCEVSFNYIHDTFGDGINISSGSADGLIADNELHNIDSPDAAIYSYDARRIDVLRNFVTNVTQNDGIKLGDSGEPVPDSRIEDNVITVIAQDGITIESSNVTVIGNHISGSASVNGVLHVDEDAKGVIIRDNVLENNPAARTLLFGRGEIVIAEFAGNTFASDGSQVLIELEGVPTGTVLDASDNVFDGIDLGDGPTSAGVLGALEDRVLHHMDDPALGLVLLAPDTVIATPNNRGIHAGLDAVPSGGVVWVHGDVYNVATTLQVPADSTLVLEPGTTLRFAKADPRIGLTISGTLIAQGEEGNPVTFTAGEATPVPGDWQGIAFAPEATAESLLEHVVIAYAYHGVGLMDPSAANPSNQANWKEITTSREAPAAIRHSTFEHYSHRAVSFIGPSKADGSAPAEEPRPEITGIEILDNDFRNPGPEVSNSGHVVVQGVAGANISGNRISTPPGRLTNGIYFNHGGGTISSNVLTRSGIYGSIHQGLSITDNELTDTAIFLWGYSRGTRVEGNRFTGGELAEYGIAVFSIGNDVDIVDNTFVDYPAAEPDPLSGTAILVTSGEQGSAVNIVGNAFRDNGGAAITTRATAESPHQLTISGNNIERNKWSVYVLERAESHGPDITMLRNRLHGNEMGLFNGSSVAIDATHNWWGVVGGPSRPSNPGDTGDAVGANVDFEPWLVGVTLNPSSTRRAIGTMATFTAVILDSNGNVVESAEGEDATPFEVQFSVNGEIAGTVSAAPFTFQYSTAQTGRDTVIAEVLFAGEPSGLVAESTVDWFRRSTPADDDDEPAPPEPPVVAGSGSGSASPDEGGSVSTPDGKITVTVPASAAEQAITLTVAPVVAAEEANVPEPEPESGIFRVASQIYQITASNEEGNPVQQFSRPLELSFQVEEAELPEDSTFEDLQVFYYDEDLGVWLPVPTEVDSTTGEVRARVSHFTTFAVMVNKEFKPMVDTAGHWAEENILRLAALGIVNGVGENRFAPEAQVTRAEFAKMLVAAAGKQPALTAPDFVDAGKQPALTAPDFADAAEIPAWAAGYVQTANLLGWLQGDAGGNFRPNEPITREEIATVVARVIDGSATGTTDFIDAGAISHWAADGVLAASQAGIITGYTDGSFRPKATATRAESSTMIWRLVKRLAQE